MTGDKFRFRFRKAGDLRLLSHLDLARCLERMLRRASIPFKSSAGFHPAPRMIFAQSMPLGVDGLREVLELETTAQLEPEDLRNRLNSQAPRGLVFTDVRVVPMKASAVPRRMVYTLPLPAERVEAVQKAATELLTREKVWVDRIKPRPRKVDIRQYLRGIHVTPVSGNDSTAEQLAELPTTQPVVAKLAIDIWVTQTGTARADELLLLLGVSDLPDAGFILARSELELRDETPPGQSDAPPEGPPDTAPLEYTPALTGDDEPADPTWGLSPSGPVVE